MRAGALEALSKCGKAALPCLGRAVAFLKDDEWWVRDGASCVLEGIGSPETDPYLDELAFALRDEEHVMCYNSMSGRLTGLVAAASAETKAELARLLAKNIPEMNYPWKKQRALNVLDSMKTDGQAALPLIDKLIEQQEKLVTDLKKESKPLDAEDWLLDNLKKTRGLIGGAKPEKK